MGRAKVRRRKKPSAFLRPANWLPVAVIGALLLVAVIAVLSRQNNNSGTSSASSRFDANFKPAVTGAPSVMVPRDSFDYGDVRLGSTVTTTFDVRNMGDQPLVILGEPQVELVEGC